MDGLVVKVTWDAPFENYDTITAYLVELRHKDFISFSSSGECDGSITSVVDNRECTINI